MWQVLYYKMRQKFPIVYVRFYMTKCDRFITKYEVYYKIHKYKPLYKLLKLYETNYVEFNVC